MLGAIADGLGLPASQVRPAYEDALSRLAGAVRQPLGEPVTPEDDLADDAADRRKALLARLEELVTEPAAYVLPLHRRDDDSGWASADWQLRRGRIVLLEGDSPAGLRLPLNSISWHPPEPAFQADPLANRGRLSVAPEPADAPVEHVDDAEAIPVTAMVAEVRDGVVYVFMPPTEALEDFVDLITRIEDAAAKVDCQVVVEGYGPPPDARLQSMSVTPDPGVIEVNVAPTPSFAAQKAQLETLYEQARLARLSTEAFDFDGTHGGTGGGNHITLGGITPADSPLLRRPDLLVSLLTYWQRHPSLSYLFAGRFVGTTSQAPRVDEGRAEALYELEIAFAEIARLSGGQDDRKGTAKPWVTDRALRHLLTDITGNTHRAEFCIDKLYSPDSARGRLGLLELRGFEMPPHYQMAMVQSLLVRALVAWFWDEPLRAPLIRHGANLHGRYLLPHFLIQDIADVAADLRAHGINFDTSWLDPFTEFRFPRIGTAVFDGVEIELRGAIEPWNTLGEESTAGGTARYVDSSVERIQVRLIGADRHRYVVTANGYPIPLLATDNPDVQVGGVRYQGLAAAQRAAPDDHGRRAAALRARRQHDGDVARRLHLPRVAPWWPRLRQPARQCGGGGVSAGTPLRGDGIHPWKGGHVGHPREAGTPIDRCRRAGHLGSSASAYRFAVMSLPAANPPDIDNLLTRYRTARAQQALFDVRPGASTGYDEFVDAAGNVRPAWQELAECVGERGRGGLDQLRSIVRSLVDNDGITYIQVDGHGDAITNGNGTLEPGPWHLDALPLVISASDWDTLESGLVQRSRLLDAVLGRFVRATPCDYQRGASAPAAVRPPGLCQGRPRHRCARQTSAVPARLRYQPRRRRRLQGERRLDPGAVGGGLCAGRPASGRTRHPRTVRADRAAACLTVGAGAAAGPDRRRS